MSDVEDRSEFIRLNLSELTKKTTLNLELVTLLYSGDLIPSSEEEYLMHDKDGDSRKIFNFYTVTARKWDDKQFKKFIEILQQLGHLGAYEIFTAEGAEVYLTKEVLSPRIIIRINLNKFCGTLRDIINEELTMDLFMKHFASYIPLEELKTRCKFVRVPVYILLDGLDEVLPNHKEAMLKILQGLRFSNHRDSKFYVAKVVLTTRPHLRKLIEENFLVHSHSLCPIERPEQIKFLTNELKIRNISRDQVVKTIEELPTGVQELMSNPLMLHLYSEIFVDKTSVEVTNIYSLYSAFIEKKHDLYLFDKQGADPAAPDTSWRKNYFTTSTVKFYNFIAINQLVRGDHLNLSSLNGNNCAEFEEPTQDKINEILSYGLLVLEREKCIFEHRSFAEYFCATMMAETKDAKLKNVLFGFGYERGNLVATFLACKLPNKAICDVVSQGWTKYIPTGADLTRYTDEKGYLLEHILANTIAYANECPGKNQLLVTDSYEEKLFFCWLEGKKIEKKKEWLENILFHDVMRKVLAAFLLSGDEAIKKFVETWWSAENDRERIRDILGKCKSSVQIAVKWLYTDGSKMHTELLFERMNRWLSVKKMKKSARSCLGRNQFFDKQVLDDANISNFYASIFSKEELLKLFSIEQTRVTDIGGVEFNSIRRCWGEEFYPKKLLQFRQKSIGCNYNSLFVFHFPEYLMDRVWNEIEGNVDGAVRIIMEDRDFGLIRMLEDDIHRWKMKIKGCRVFGRPSNYSDRETLLKLRIRLVKEILARVNWSKFMQGNGSIRYNTYNMMYLIAYGRLEFVKWSEVLAQRKVVEYVDFDQMNNIFRCLVISAINDLKNTTKNFDGLVMAPFDSVVNWLKIFSGTFESPFIEIILSCFNKSELKNLVHETNDDSMILTQLPSVWEVLFLKGGTGHKRKLKELNITWKGWMEIINAIFWSVGDYTHSCCSVGSIIEESCRVAGYCLKKDAYKDKTKTSIVTEWFNSKDMLFWSENVDIGKCFLKNVVKAYYNLFKDDLSWVDSHAEVIHIPLIAIGEEIGWTELVTNVERQVLENFDRPFSFENICKPSPWAGWYNRACDWFRLFVIFPEARENIPQDFKKQTEVCSNSDCCLLRVWIQMFGEKKTMRDADKHVFEQGVSFWEYAAVDVNDGELLHIAVEVGSLLGVQKTSYPGMLLWKDTRNGKTALELSLEKWGHDNEITRFLLKRTESLFPARPWEKHEELFLSDESSNYWDSARSRNRKRKMQQ